MTSADILRVPWEAHVVEAGMWCGRCLLPSAVRVVMTLVSNPTCRVGEFVGCTDCGEHWRP